RSISMPFGLTTDVPLSVPTWKPAAGGVRPTISVSGFIVGGAAVRFAPAVAVIRLTASALAASTRTIFFTGVPPALIDAHKCSPTRVARARLGLQRFLTPPAPAG